MFSGLLLSFSYVTRRNEKHLIGLRHRFNLYLEARRVTLTTRTSVPNWNRRFPKGNPILIGFTYVRRSSTKTKTVKSIIARTVLTIKNRGNKRNYK